MSSSFAAYLLHLAVLAGCHGFMAKIKIQIICTGTCVVIYFFSFFVLAMIVYLCPFEMV